MEIMLERGYTLRELNESDLARLYELMARPEVMRYLPDRFESLDEVKDVLSWLRSNYGKEDYIRLSYAIARGELLAGWVSAGPLPSDETKRELAYCVHPDHQGRGVASSACVAFVRWLRAEGLAGELWAEADPDNAASIRVLEKCGFAAAGWNGASGAIEAAAAAAAAADEALGEARAQPKALFRLPV